MRSPGWQAGRPYGCYMAEQSAAVIPSHPPEPIMKLMNPLLRYGLRTPLAGGRASSSWC